MGQHVRHGYHGSHLGFNAFNEVVALLHGPVSRYQDMNGNKGPRAGLTRPEGMKFNALRPMGFQHLFAGSLLRGR